MRIRRAAPLSAMLALTLLAGCQAAKQVQLERPKAFERPTERAATSKEAAVAYLECSLRVYYTAAEPVSPRMAVNTCFPYMDQYRRLYLAEQNYSGVWAGRLREDLISEAVALLEERIAIYGAREAV